MPSDLRRLNRTVQSVVPYLKKTLGVRTVFSRVSFENLVAIATRVAAAQGLLR